MALSIRMHLIKCLEESNELSPSDEPYVLVTAARIAAAGIPQPPDVRTFLYGPWEMDADQVNEIIVEPPFWGTNSQPDDILNVNDVIFVVSVMENDEGSPDGNRLRAQLAATGSLGGSVTRRRNERVDRLLKDIRDALSAQISPIVEDDQVGTEELRLASSDLITSGTKDKVLKFESGRKGSYELTFHVAGVQRVEFSQSTHLAAVSRHREHMEIWAVDGNGMVRGNVFDGRWRGWYELGGAQFNQGTYLTALARHPERMEVWAVGKNGIVLGIPFDEGWQNWYPLKDAAFKPGSPLAAVSRHPDRMEVWGINVDGTLMGRPFENGDWDVVGWYPLPLPNGERFRPGSHVAAVSRDLNLMEVWALGDDGVVHGIGFDEENGWSRWYQLDGVKFNPGTRLEAVSRHPNHMEVLAIDPAGLVRGIRFDGGWPDPSHWYTIEDAAFTPGTDLAAVSRHPNRLELWAIGRDDGIVRGNWFDAEIDTENWQGWYVLDKAQFNQGVDLVGVSRSRTGNFGAVTDFMEPSLMEMWSVGTNGIVLGIWYDGQWHEWYPLAWSYEG